MQSKSQATVQILPSPTEDQRIEVIIEGESSTVALRYSTWTEGLGWCCQKTIKLEGDQLDALHQALTVARHRLARRHAEAGEAMAVAKLIRLPNFG